MALVPYIENERLPFYAKFVFRNFVNAVPMRMLIHSYNTLLGGVHSHRLGLEGNETTLICSATEVCRLPDETNYDLFLFITDTPFTCSEPVLRLIRNRQRVCILSSVHNESVVLSAYRMGVLSYLSLPVNIGYLIRKIRNLQWRITIC